MCNTIHLRYAVYEFDAFIYCNMITTIALVNTCLTSHNHHFLFMGEQLKSILLGILKFVIQCC